MMKQADSEWNYKRINHRQGVEEDMSHPECQQSVRSPRQLLWWRACPHLQLMVVKIEG
jgi:hypothetical protein